jgi:hypothetical protein
MVLTEPEPIGMQPHGTASPASRPLRVMPVLLVVGLCACVVVVLSLASGPQTVLISKSQEVEAAEVGAVERRHDVLVQKSKVLAAKIGDLARTLKRQESSLTGDGKVARMMCWFLFSRTQVAFTPKRFLNPPIPKTFYFLGWYCLLSCLLSLLPLDFLVTLLAARSPRQT